MAKETCLCLTGPDRSGNSEVRSRVKRDCSCGQTDLSIWQQRPDRSGNSEVRTRVIRELGPISPVLQARHTKQTHLFPQYCNSDTRICPSHITCASWYSLFASSLWPHFSTLPARLNLIIPSLSCASVSPEARRDGMYERGREGGERGEVGGGLPQTRKRGYTAVTNAHRDI